MEDNQKKILELLEQDKINASEAERLLDKLRDTSEFASPEATKPRYLRIRVNDPDEDGDTVVNIKIPLQLLRAGVKLASLIPQDAQIKINKSMSEKGISFSLNDLSPEKMDELDINVNSAEGKTVRIFCE